MLLYQAHSSNYKGRICPQVVLRCSKAGDIVHKVLSGEVWVNSFQVF